MEEGQSEKKQQPKNGQQRANFKGESPYKLGGEEEGRRLKGKQKEVESLPDLWTIFLDVGFTLLLGAGVGLLIYYLLNSFGPAVGGEELLEAAEESLNSVY